MAESDFPKSNGDILFASEVNDFFNYPLRILNSTSASTTFTPTKSDSTIVVWVKGDVVETSANTAVTINIDLDVASVTKDTITIQDDRGSGGGTTRQSFSLMWSADDLAAASTDIAITTNLGGIANLKIIVMEYTKE